MNTKNVDKKKDNQPVIKALKLKKEYIAQIEKNIYYFPDVLDEVLQNLQITDTEFKKNIYNNNFIDISFYETIERITAEITEKKIREDYKYEVLSDDCIRISKYKGCGKNVIVPNIIEGRKVTYIANPGFRGCDTITSITLLEGMTALGMFTFQDCKYFREVILPKGLISISWGGIQRV